MDAVHLQNIRFAYKSGPLILGIDELRIPSGGRSFLYGPSGSGKTTLLSLISGILSPQQGSAQVLGQELTTLSPSARDTLRGSEIGYIFQGFNLIPYLSVEENIALPCQVHDARRARLASTSLQAEVRRLAHRLDLNSHLHEPVTHLSVGQQQRVAIARAIIGSPALIIADEPTSALDTDRREAFLALLTEVTDEAKQRNHLPLTLLFCSHDRSLASQFDSQISLPDLNRAAHSLQAAAL